MRSAHLHSRDWEELALLDPLWAILSDPAKRFGRWNLAEFFRSGAEDVSQLMEKASQLGLPQARRRAVDFGCGVGRLTRALGEHFAECHGVDISNSMVEAARRLTPRCEFRQGADLGSFPADWADLIYSNMVLQHQPDQAGVFRIIAGMLRVLAPGGLLVFQMPISMPWRFRLQLR
ncbi:MAG: class I SAM-dependent methyltransferase, partial [Actinomycetota bacterium]